MEDRENLIKYIVISLLGICLILLGIGLGTRYYNDKKEKEEEVASAIPTPTATPSPTPEPTPVVETYEASLFMVGDALLHVPIYYYAQQGDGSYEFSPYFEYIEPIAKQYDLAYYNQETILGGTELVLSGYPKFNAPQEYGRDMVEAGFNLVSTANNHSLDRGEAGIISSENFWATQEGVVVDGTNKSQEGQDKVKINEVNGISYAFISYTYGMNGLLPPEGKEYLVNCYEGHVDELLNKIKYGKENADVVIVAIHWGNEYWTEPSEEQFDLAKQMAEAGADIIIGNHPHIIQPIEWLNDHKTICFYALGNFISAQEGDNLAGMMAALKITKTVTDGEVAIEISDVKADLHYTYSENYANSRVIPFSKLEGGYYTDMYERLLPIITNLDDSIQIGGF